MLGKWVQSTNVLYHLQILQMIQHNQKPTG
jgi:hypothetical protein